MSRRTLWTGNRERIGCLLPGKAGDRGRSGADNRLFIDAVPPLVRAGVRAFQGVEHRSHFEYVLVDATISKVHADATSQKGA